MYTAGTLKKPWQQLFMLVLSFILALGMVPMSMAQAEEVNVTPVGPGGVDAPALWLKADRGIGVGSGEKVSIWEDQSSKMNNAKQDVIDIQPVYWDDKEHNTNFNPVLKYDGTKSFMNLDVSKLPQGKNPRSIVTVAKTNRTAGIDYIISWGKSDPAAYSGIGILHNGTRGGLTSFNTSKDQTLYTADGFLGTTFSNEQFVTWTGANGVENEARLYSKMKQVQELNDFGKDNDKLWDTGNSGGAVIGKVIPADTGRGYWQGTIEEIIVYDHALTDEERHKVSTYLAIKYGYTMDQTTPISYVDSNMGTIWDSVANSVYTHRVTSIGRDDKSGLMQRQAKAQETGSILTIALGNSVQDTNSANKNNFLMNSSFFTFGDNGANIEFKTPITKDEEKLLLMERIYKVQKMNWAETQITLQVDKLEGTTKLPRYVVISSDEQFNTQDSFHLIENGQVNINTVDFGPDSYFTIAAAATPLAAPEATLTGDKLTWNVVEHADEYEVTIELEDGTKRKVEVTGTALVLSQLEPSLKPGTYKVTVTAKSNNSEYANSEASQLVTYVVPADKTALQNKVNEAKGLTGSNYTEESWSNLEGVRTSAELVLNDPDATQAEVEQALDKLQQAMKNLVALNGVLDELNLADDNDQAIALKPAFDPSQSNYTVTVGNDVHSISINPIALYPDDTEVRVNLNGASVSVDEWGNLTLQEGKNIVTVGVYDKAGNLLSEYMIEIVRESPSRSSKLTSLVPSVGSLSLAFDPYRESYTMSVANSVYQLQFTPTSLDPEAKIEIRVNNGDWQEVTSGSISDYLGLNIGANSIAVRVTDKNGESSDYTVNVTRGFSSDGSTTTPETPEDSDTQEDSLDVTLNGNNNPFATGTTSTSGGRTTTSVEVDPDKLIDALSNSIGQDLAIHSPNGDMTVEGLTADTLKQLSDKGANLKIGNLLAIYPVPAGQMSLSSVAGQLGNAALSDIGVRIDIKRSSEDVIASAKSKAAAAGYELLVDPVDLNLTFSHDGQNVRSGQLNGYAVKYIALPAGIDPNRITTGVITNPDGSVYHVPTVVMEINNRYFAQINDLRSSGTYSVIWNPQDFDDVRNHWGKEDVNNIAARLDLKGNGDNTFSPVRSVTRSEFAEIVVTGLGLMRSDAPQANFPDISASAWYARAVAIANEFDIVRGYEDGSFSGGQQITREQGFSMIARAYRLIQSEDGAGQNTSALSQYKDGAKVSNWAKADVAQLIEAGIIQGNGPELLSPQATMTRAEVTALIARLLKSTNLIDK